MTDSNSAKPRRKSTDSTTDVLQDGEPSYAQVAEVNLSIMSPDEKLDHIIREMNTVKILTQQVQRQQQQLNELHDTVDNMNVRMVHTEQLMSSVELRVIDLEARSRRNNLIFLNNPESAQETDEGCEEALVSFLVNSLQVPEADLSRVVFQLVHPLGRFRRGVAPDGQPWKPRPIIVGFRDYKIRQEIFQLAPRLRKAKLMDSEQR